MADDLASTLKRNIPLSEMIQTLRQELSVALAEGQDSRLRFLAKKLELELQITVERESGAGGKIKFNVLAVEGEGESKLGRKQQDTHVFRIELEPRWLTERGELVSIPIADPDTRAPNQG